ncbi:MAG: hypothetical protein KAR47_12915, partial [Planctomycetes bacterium]|nr:hypothetical protein [Planctomycetota bacterium]
MAVNNKIQGLYDPRNEHDACGIGAVVNISGKRDHSIIEYARETLLNLHHRGAAGADEITGDGAGILLQIPHELFAAETGSLGLPEPGRYGVGMIFWPTDDEVKACCESILQEAIGYYGMKVLGWRPVPVSNDCLGEIALKAEP